MSHWNHRILHKHHAETDTHTYHIHEVYYDDDGSIKNWTENPVAPMGETPDELREEIQYFLKAFQKPILVETKKREEEIPVEDVSGRIIKEEPKWTPIISVLMINVVFINPRLRAVNCVAVSTAKGFFLRQKLRNGSTRKGPIESIRLFVHTVALIP